MMWENEWDTCKNYNLVHGEPEDISFTDNLSGEGIFTGKMFSTTAGVDNVTISQLIGANIVLLLREEAPYDPVSSFTEGRQYLFDETIGKLTFPTVFGPNEKLTALYYTGTVPVTFSEPLTVQEVKNRLRLEGFTDEDQSLSDFDMDDTLIGELITSARDRAEKYCGISIVTHAWRMKFSNYAGGQRFRYGPMISVSSFKDCEGNDISTDNYKIVGDEIRLPCAGDMVIEYYAGYTSTSSTYKSLKMAILKQVVWDYTHAGDEKGYDLCQDAINILNNYSRREIIT